MIIVLIIFGYLLIGVTFWSCLIVASDADDQMGKLLEDDEHGILIEGMKMPKACFECPMYRWEENFVTGEPFEFCCIVGYLDDCDYCENKADGCPLIEVTTLNGMTDHESLRNI